MKHNIKSYKGHVTDIEEKGIVTITISKFGNTDSDGDVISKGAFKKTFNEGINRIKHVLDHELKQSSVVGLPLEMYETDTHAVVKSAINLEKQIGRDLFSDYKFFAENGRTLEHSYMFDPVKYEAIKENGNVTGINVKELRMFEYSTVALGANPETGLLDLKGLQGGDLMNSLIERIKYGKYSDQLIEKINKTIDQLEKDLEPCRHSERKPNDTSENGLNFNYLLENL